MLLVPKGCQNVSCLPAKTVLRLGINTINPIVTVTKRYKNGAVLIDGLFSRIFNFIFYNFDVMWEYHAPKKSLKEQEHRMPNGTWTGIPGKLQEGKMDLFLGPFILNEAAQNDFEPFTPFVSREIHIMASMGKNGQNSFFRFLFQIETTVWYTLMVTLVTLIITSAIVDAFEVRTVKIVPRAMYDYIWVYLAALFSEGSPREPPSRISQMLLFLWLYSVLVFSNCVVSQFKAALMVQQNDDYVKTVQDIADKPNLMPMFIPKSQFELALMSPLEQYKKVYQRAQDNKEEAFLNFRTFGSTATYQKIKDGNAVIVTDKDTSKCLLTLFCFHLKGNRKLYFLDETLYPHSYSVLAKKGFPPFLRKSIDRRTHSLNEGGFFDMFNALDWRNYWKCELIGQDEEEASFRLTHLASVFYMLLVCSAVSFVVFIAEIIAHKKCLRKKYISEEIAQPL